MSAIDKIFTDCPFYGVPKIKHTLKTEHNIVIGRDHTRRLMRLMGLEAIYPKRSRKTSIPDKNHAIYPYLIKDISPAYPDHIWGNDITYIRLAQGWCYLCAILDWYSRYVVGWTLSLSLESSFCVEAIGSAIKNYGSPEINNTDQGSQFTDKQFVEILKENKVQISMDGRGRYSDNIFTERLWRTVKYEEVYLKSYVDIDDARNNLTRYFNFYNQRRPHQSLSYKTPAEVYFENKKRPQPIKKLTTDLPSNISTFTV